ncbi:hypothetical protein TNCV_3076591 [Trichonephila clavipes]|nr:hypothetical protein TNCV_3076591 [Trichonephila clavipes]
MNLILCEALFEAKNSSNFTVLAVLRPCYGCQGEVITSILSGESFLDCDSDFSTGSSLLLPVVEVGVCVSHKFTVVRGSEA